MTKKELVKRRAEENRKAIEERVIKVAEVMLLSKDAPVPKTIRELARDFSVGRMTVANDLNDRLKKISPTMHIEVRKILDRNKLEGTARGGKSTQELFRRRREELENESSSENKDIREESDNVGYTEKVSL